jgi:hypothetical protein
MRLVVLVLSLLVLAASLLGTSLTVWLQTAAGRGWVERALARETNERLALTLTVGRTKGSIIRGIRLERIALYDAQGGLVARADVVSARYRLYRLIRFHEVDQIALERPVIARLPSAAARAAPRHGKPTRLSVHNFAITDGSLRWRGHRVQHLSANTAIEIGGPRAQGQRLEGDVNFVLDEQPLCLHAKAELDGARVGVTAELHGIGFAVDGRADWADRRLTASLEKIDADATLLARAGPLAGSGPLHAHGTLVGPLDALDLELQGQTDNRRFALGALVGVPQQKARVTGSVVAPTRSAVLQARAILHGHALDVTALEVRTGQTRLTGAARVDSGVVDATLAFGVAPAEAAVIGIHPAAPIRLAVTLHGPAGALGVRVQGRLRAAEVALAGRIDLHARRGQVRFVAHDVRPSEIERGAPPLAFSGAFAFDGALGEHGGVEGRLSVNDGSLRVEGLSFERLRGVGRVRFDQPGEARVQSLSGQLQGRRPRPIAVQTVIRWNRRALRADASRVALDESRATGDLVYTHDPVTRQPLVTIRAQRLSLSPPLVQEALHRRPSKEWPGKAKLVWMPDGTGLTFALYTEEGPLSGAARLRRDRGALELPSIALALGGSRFRGAARVKNGQIVASVDELLLEPRLVHWLWPALEPARTIRVEGVAAGPLHALDLQLVATAGVSTARLRGRVDLRARSFHLLATFDTFYLQSIKETRTSRVNLELYLMGRLVEGGMAGTLTVRHAWGKIEGLPLDAARLDVTLNGPKFNVDQVLIGVPGAVFEGKGGGSYRDFHIGYGVVITDALQLRKVPKDLRLMVGLSALTPGRSVVGAIRRHQGGKIELTHHAIPPPFRFVNLLYHLLLGHPLHLTVH